MAGLTLVKDTPRAANIVPPKHRPWWLAVAQFVLVAVVSVCALELIFALAGVGEQEYLRPDANTGFEPTPNKPITWRKEGFARVKYNRFGYQDKDWSVEKAPGTARIAFVGDSYVEALQVPREKNFCNLIESHLNATGKKFEVMNFGVSACNLGQMYLRTKAYVFPFHPDAVIVPLRVDENFEQLPRTNGGFLTARPTFFVDKSGMLCLDRSVEQQWLRSAEGKRMRATGWLRQNSHIWGVLSTAAEQVCGWLQQVRSPKFHLGADVTDKQTAFGTNDEGPESTVAYADMPPTWRAPRTENAIKTTKWAWPLCDALLAKFKADCDAQGCKLIIVRLPAVSHQYNDLETSFLKDSCSKYQIPFFDASPAFEAQLARSKQPLFYNTHFTPLGHEVFANAVSKNLTETGLLR